MIERSKTPILFFSKIEKKQIEAAIVLAEKETSAEIRLHLERKAGADLMLHAREVFQKLGMTKTADRNGVLIFFGIQSKRFAILGDQGIDSKVSHGFWDEIVQAMSVAFKDDDFAGGLAKGIEGIATQLKKHFPYKDNDQNELPDEISFSF